MMRTAAATADLSPEAISPLVVWLGSAESREVTGRVFGVWGNAITVLEGWVNGPSVSRDTRWDPAGLSAVVPGLLAKAAPNAAPAGQPQAGRLNRSPLPSPRSARPNPGVGSRAQPGSPRMLPADDRADPCTGPGSPTLVPGHVALRAQL